MSYEWFLLELTSSRPWITRGSVCIRCSCTENVWGRFLRPFKEYTITFCEQRHTMKSYEFSVSCSSSSMFSNACWVIWIFQRCVWSRPGGSRIRDCPLIREAVKFALFKLLSKVKKLTSNAPTLCLGILKSGWLKVWMQLKVIPLYADCRSNFSSSFFPRPYPYKSAWYSL